jgi:hypothetical protein
MSGYGVETGGICVVFWTQPAIKATMLSKLIGLIHCRHCGEIVAWFWNIKSTSKGFLLLRRFVSWKSSLVREAPA